MYADVSDDVEVGSGVMLAFDPGGTVLASSDEYRGIRLWDVTTGAELKRITIEGVSSIAFSPDGKTIAGGNVNGTIKLWNVPAGDGLRTLEKHSSSINSVTFSPDGKLLASGGDDGTVRLWNLIARAQIRLLTGNGESISSIAFSPNGKLLASGRRDGTINLWDVGNGALIHSIKGYKRWSVITSVTFDPSGEKLATSSIAHGGVKLWDVATGKELRTFTGNRNDINSLAFSPDGKILAGADIESTVDIWEVDNGILLRSIAVDTSDLALPNICYSVAFSPDNKVLAGGCDGRTKLWNADTGEELRTFEKSNTAYSLVFSPDGKVLAGGGSFWEVSTGARVGSFNVSDGEPPPAFSPDWKLIASPDINDKIKFFSLPSNKELASLTFVDREDWAVVGGDGHFDASEGAQKLMHYSYGLEVINLEQLKEMYYEPGLLQKLLGYSKEPLRPIVPLTDVKLHPEIVEQKFDSNTGKLTVKLKNRGGGIGKTEVYLNGKLTVADARDEKLKQNPNVPLNEVVTLNVNLPQSSFIKGEENQIKVVMSNYLKEIGKGNIQSRGVVTVWKPEGKEEFTLPTLYAIVGGVSDYAGEQLNLRFAAKDAEDFAGALQLGARRLFCPKENPDCLDKVQITTLSTSGREGTIQPTKENFRKAFADVAAKAKPEDILVVYLAGHGVSFGTGTDTYFYLTKEARTTSREDLAKVIETSTISSEELTEWLTQTEWSKGQKGIRALKQVLILDTCASGTAAEKLALSAKRELSGDQIRAIEFLKDKTGTFVLMASTADAPSYEASQYGQGLLTYSLLQAMKGAALDKGEYIDVQRLFDYAQKEVPHLAENIGGIQRPIVSAPLGRTFVIGQMTEAEKSHVNLPAPKPLLLRPLLTNPETGDDDLKLIPELRKRLDAESSYEVARRRGSNAPVLIYIDDDSFPGAVRVTGTYTVEGDKVRVKARLRRNGQTVATLKEIITAKEKVLDELIAAVRGELSKIKID